MSDGDERMRRGTRLSTLTFAGGRETGCLPYDLPKGTIREGFVGGEVIHGLPRPSMLRGARAVRRCRLVRKSNPQIASSHICHVSIQPYDNRLCYAVLASAATWRSGQRGDNEAQSWLHMPSGESPVLKATWVLGEQSQICQMPRTSDADELPT
jgi:hypothetical protein